MAPDDDTTRRGFAELTALLEDATGVAAEGQRAGLTAAEIRDLPRRLRGFLKDAAGRLDRLPG